MVQKSNWSKGEEQRTDEQNQEQKMQQIPLWFRTLSQISLGIRVQHRPAEEEEKSCQKEGKTNIQGETR